MQKMYYADTWMTTHSDPCNDDDGEGQKCIYICGRGSGATRNDDDDGEE